MASNHSYHGLLTSLSQRLSKDNLKSLIFSCGDVLPSFAAENLTAGTDFFRELQYRGHLGPDNYDYLRQKLVLIGRNDLASELPDNFEIMFGQASARGTTQFGCVPSPALPVTLTDNFRVPKFCPPNTAHRAFLLHLAEQLTAEDLQKLTYLLCHDHHHDELTAIKFATLLEREQDTTSLKFIDDLSSCLEIIGRIDLARYLNSLKAPQAFLSSLSTSQQQLDLKISLLLHSKHVSYNFHMKALSALESDHNARRRLLIPVMKTMYQSFSRSTILPLAQDLWVVLQDWNGVDSIDTLISQSLQKIFDFNQAYMTRVRCIHSSNEPHLEQLQPIHAKCFEAYERFDFIMDAFNWNSEGRNEVRENARCRATPFGTPADHACQYIFDLCQETCRCSEIDRQWKLAEENLQTLHGIFGCCCCNALVLQWLATLLCLSTSNFGDSNPLDLSKHKDLLLTLVRQMKDNIEALYPLISLVVGDDSLQKVTPLLDTIGISQPTGNRKLLQVPDVNPLALLFHSFLIQLLAVAAMDITDVGTYDVSLTDYLLRNHTTYASHVIMVIAAGMKKQVEIFQEKALAEDNLCKGVISSLTLVDECHKR